MIINRLVNHSGKKYYFNIETIGFDCEDKKLKIIATDGRSVWESFKSKNIR